MAERDITDDVLRLREDLEAIFEAVIRRGEGDRPIPPATLEGLREKWTKIWQAFMAKLPRDPAAPLSKADALARGLVPEFGRDGQLLGYRRAMPADVRRLRP